jgi:hypothetical protein
MLKKLINLLFPKNTDGLLLTGHAKTDFLKEYGHLKWELDERYQIALIIDFFDKYQISIQNWGYQEVEYEIGYDAAVYYKNKYYENVDFKKTRLEALRQAILNANQMYDAVFYKNRFTEILNNAHAG